MLKMAGMLPSGSSFALLCTVPCKTTATDTDSPKWLVLDTKLPWSFSKALFWARVTDRDFHPALIDCCVGTETGMGKQPSHQTQREPGGRAGLCAGSVHANLVVSSAFLFFFSLHLEPGCDFCEITVLYSPRRALRPVPGKCCRNVKHPYG